VKRARRRWRLFQTPSVLKFQFYAFYFSLNNTLQL
jgi:hypothetical protein